MELYLEYIIFIVSLLTLSLFILINYKIGKKEGIKKALYRITYRSLCVIIAFILSPYITEFILNYDLYEGGHSIRYNGMHFYRIIDFIEEIIVHNEVLNDIYNLFPSLKNLLMDFPQVLFIPFGYLLTFILASIVLAPLYFYLSYRRKRRVLYDKSYNKRGPICAGILTAVQSVFLVSIILTPVNGLAKIYKDSANELIDENTTICQQNVYLEKYDFACKVIEAYNNSVFGLIGESPVNDYIYGSLTRIKYDENDTSLNREIVSIARAGIALNKTGLIDAINITDFSDVTSLNFKGLTEEDIDVIVEAFEQSLYTRDVIYDVYEWSKAYLDWLIEDLIDKEFVNDNEYVDVIGELKIILRAINYMLNNRSFVENVTKIYGYVDEYIEKYGNTINAYASTRLFFDIVYEVDVEALTEVYLLLKDSKIYNNFIPHILDYLLSTIEVRITSNASSEELNQVVLHALNVVKIIQNHAYIYDFLHLVNDLTKDEVHYLATVVEYLNSSQNFKYMLYDLAEYGIGTLQMKIDIPTEVIFKIKEWERELELAHLVVQIIYTYEKTGVIDYDKAWYGLTTYNNTILFKTAFDYLIDMLPEIFTTWISGKDYKYLVGEYV